MKNNQDTSFDKAVERYSQRFKILVNKPDFQNDIAAFRKKWDIDPSKLQASDSVQDWWNTHYANDDRWRREVWPKHLEEIPALEKAALDMGNVEVNYGPYLDRKKELWDEKPVNAFYADLDALLRKHKLPPKWQQAVQSYAFTDKEQYSGSVGLTVKSHLGITDADEDTVSVVLDANTTRQDLIDAWPRIKMHLDKLRHKTSDKYQPFNDVVFERSKQAYELHYKQGKTYRAIAEEDFGGNYTYADVADMVKNYKKLLGIN